MDFFQVLSFVCTICKKTFDNATALRNHHNFTHLVYSDGTEEPPEQEQIDEAWQSSSNAVDEMSMEEVYFIQELNSITEYVHNDSNTYIRLEISDGIDPPKDSKEVLHRTNSPPSSIINISGPFTCSMPSVHNHKTQCGEMFLDCCQYSLHHREKHTRRKNSVLRCQVCETQLDKENVKSEFAIPDAAIFPCCFCSLTFLNKPQMDEHVKIAHIKSKPHECSICNKRFTQIGGLQQHLRLHTGVRPFKCTYCEKSFTQKAGLEQHVRIHTKVKPFKCIVCNKSFSQSVHVRQHMRTHTNIQPFVCNVCGRRFKQTSHLNVHMRSHDRQQDVPAPQAGPSDMFQFTVMPVIGGETMYYSAEVPTLNPENSTTLTLLYRNT